MSANIKASTDGTQAIIGVGGVDQMTVSNAGVVTANSFSGLNNSSVTATGSTTARTLANRFADVVNVKDFGAVGDGIVDDTAAIQAAINYCATQLHTKGSLQLGVGLFLPSGTYQVTQLNIINPMSFYGDGSASTRLYQKNNTNADLLVVTGVNHFEIHGICVDGNKSNQTSNNGNGAFFNECYNVVMSDCEFRYCSENGFRSFGGAYLTFDQCSFNNNYANGTYHTTTGVAIDNGTYYIRGSNSVAYENGYDGFCYDPGSNDCTLTGCISHNNSGTGFNVFGNTSGVQPKKITISACISELNQLEGFSLHSCRNIVLDGCISQQNGQVNSGSRINGIIIQNDMIGQAKEYNIVISDTIIDGSNGHGIYIDSVTSDAITTVLLSNILIKNVGQNVSNLWDGIYIGKADNVFISDSYIKDDTSNMRYALNVSNNASNIRITGGQFEAGISGIYNVPNNSLFCSLSNTNNEISLLNTVLDKGLTLQGSPRPRLKIVPTTNNGSIAGAVGRFYSRSSNWYETGFSGNMQWNGNWNLDDTSNTGWNISAAVDQDTFQIQRAAAGSNPVTPSTMFQVSGTISSNQTAAWLLVNNGTSTTLKQVLIGAANSGGSGFRNLIVTN